MPNLIINPKTTIKIGREPMVLFPLAKWLEIEDELEDLEAHKSKNLEKEIKKRRKERTVSLEKLLKKYRI